MAGSAVMPNQPFHIRSISLPSRSHPTVLRVEEELRKLKIFMASSSTTAQMMCIGFRGLRDLYDCMEEFLRLPNNQQALRHPHQKTWLEEQLDCSLRLLDLSGVVRDSLDVMKEHVQDLRSAIRRKGDTTYISSRKKAQKVIKNCLRSLKGMDSKSISCSVIDEASDISMAVKVLMETREITVSLLRSVVSFLSKPAPKPKASRWSIISKTISKRKVACEVEGASEEKSIHMSICAPYDFISCKDADGVRVLEVSLEGLETGLECLFRRLIQNRVSLLNILSL